MPTVLMTLMNLEIGGAETHTVLLARHMQELGYRVLVASSGGVFESTIADYGIKHYQLPLDNYRWGSLRRAARSMRRIVLEEKVDLIHAHARIPAFVAAWVRFSTGVKLLTTAHALFVGGFPWRYLSCWGEKTIAVSPDIREHLIVNFGVDESRIILIPNGIDTEVFRPDLSAAGKLRSTLVTDTDRLVITYVSRLDQHLAPVAQNLILACQRLHSKLPIKLLIVGDGQYFGEVAKQAQEVNRITGTELVTLLGSRTDVNLLLAAADLVVGVSRVALEAMSCERNVILAGGEGYGALILEENLPLLDQDNFTGRRQNKPATPEDFYRTILEYANQPEPVRTQRAAKLRQHVVERYSGLDMARKTAQVYEELLGK